MYLTHFTNSITPLVQSSQSYALYCVTRNSSRCVKRKIQNTVFGTLLLFYTVVNIRFTILYHYLLNLIPLHFLSRNLLPILIFLIRTSPKATQIFIEYFPYLKLCPHDNTHFLYNTWKILVIQLFSSSYSLYISISTETFIRYFKNLQTTLTSLFTLRSKSLAFLAA